MTDIKLTKSQRQMVEDLKACLGIAAQLFESQPRPRTDDGPLRVLATRRDTPEMALAILDCIGDRLPDERDAAIKDLQVAVEVARQAFGEVEPDVVFDVYDRLFGEE